MKAQFDFIQLINRLVERSIFFGIIGIAIGFAFYQLWSPIFFGLGKIVGALESVQ
jgi:hypothetical protein